MNNPPPASEVLLQTISANKSLPKFPDIPRARYFDTGFYQSEIDSVFKKSWLFAGNCSEVPQPGSYRLLDIPFAPVFLIRGKDGKIRAFLNSCSHRGAPVLRSEQGKANVLSCQYHAWTFDLQGSLISVPRQDEFKELDLSDRGLRNVRCETWGGFVFINFDVDAQPLQEWLAPIINRHKNLADQPLRLVAKKSFDIECNWKVVVEAFIETYHVPVIHPNTAYQVVESENIGLLLHANGHGTMINPYLAQVVMESDYRKAFLPISPQVSPLQKIQNFPYPESQVTAGMFPNMIMPFDCVGHTVLTKWPLAVNKTRLDVAWYGLEWGDGPAPEEWQARVAGFTALAEEDIVNLAPIQRSIEADPAKGIPLGAMESRLWHFNAQVDRSIGADRIAPSLKIDESLLDDFIEP